MKIYMKKRISSIKIKVKNYLNLYINQYLKKREN